MVLVRLLCVHSTEIKWLLLKNFSHRIWHNSPNEATRMSQGLSEPGRESTHLWQNVFVKVLRLFGSNDFQAWVTSVTKSQDMSASLWKYYSIFMVLLFKYEFSCELWLERGHLQQVPPAPKTKMLCLLRWVYQADLRRAASQIDPNLPAVNFSPWLCVCGMLMMRAACLLRLDAV